MSQFNFMKEEFPYVKEAFLDELSDKNSKNLSPTIYVNDKYVKLQFHGWEIVLLESGNYYINDTSGG